MLLRISLKLHTTMILLFFSSYSISQWNQKGASIYGQTAQDETGTSVDLSWDGFRLAVGTPNRTTQNGVTGQVIVYSWDGVNWVQMGSPLDGDSSEVLFGRSIALTADGNLLVVGGSGFVKTFYWNGNDWESWGNKKEEPGGIGYSVAISDDWLKLVTGMPSSSLIRIYDWIGNDWVEQTTLQSVAPITGLGIDVVISSDGNSISASGFNNSQTSGGVTTFDWDSTSWTNYVNNMYGSSIHSEFGRSLGYALNDSLLIVGAPKDDSFETNAGKVQVYKRNGFSWSPHGSALFGEAANDWFGYSVSISEDGQMLAASGIKNSDGGLWAGHVRLYEWDGNDWQQKGQDIDGSNTNDESGTSTALSYFGKIVAIGSPLNDGNWINAGEVRVFEDGIVDVGLLENELIGIGPNPAKDFIGVTIGSDELIHFDLYDLTGRLVLRSEIQQQFTHVNVSNLIRGNYIAKLTKPNGEIVKATSVLLK